MNSIGNILKEARLKKSITFEEVHSRTKIHPRVLQLLEEDKFEKLPSPLFVKSFLKSYAEFLEVNPEELIQTYEKEKKEPEQVLYIKSAAERERANQLSTKFLRAGTWVAGFLAAGLVAFYLFQAVGGWISQERTPGKAKAKAVKAVSSKAKEEKPKTAASKATVEKTAQSTEWLRSVGQGNFPKLNSKTPLELTIKATDSVWVRVTCDEKVLFQNILKRGASETWTANKEIQIWTGNSSNMSLVLNRYSLGSPGKGVIKRMVINHEGVRISS